MKGLDNLLEGDEPTTIQEEEHNEFQNVLITEYAFEKAFAYARITSQYAKRSMECGGYLVTPKHLDDRIARDAFLARDQKVAGGQFKIEAEDVIKAGRELDEMGYKVLGWWHSHGILDTFFSPTDDGGQMTVLNEIAAFNYVTRTKEEEVKNLETEIEDDKILLYDPQNAGRKYEIQLPQNGLPETLAQEFTPDSLKVVHEQKIGFAYGLVVNQDPTQRKPYAEIATREICLTCRDSHDQSRVVGVSLYSVKGQTVEFDEDLLRKEVEARVKIPKLFDFSKYSKRKWGNGRVGELYIPDQIITPFQKTPKQRPRTRVPKKPFKPEED